MKIHLNSSWYSDPEIDEQEAERLLQQGLGCCGLQEDELSCLKKGDARKKVIAWYIRKNTSVRVEWITTRLQMGSASNFSYNYRAVEAAKEGGAMGVKDKNYESGGLTLLACLSDLCGKK